MKQEKPTPSHRFHLWWSHVRGAWGFPKYARKYNKADIGIIMISTKELYAKYAPQILLRVSLFLRP